MAEHLSDRLREFINSIQGSDITLKDIRSELKIDPTSPAFDGVRVLMLNLTKEKIIRSSGKKDGCYHVIQQVKPVALFSVKREQRPLFNLNFPRDVGTGKQLDFAGDIVVREGDLITLGGVKSAGKTTLCLNFTGMNVDGNPVLMGNEYTNLVEGAYEPSPRFFARLNHMGKWVEWLDEEGCDKVTLLPVRGDYAEHIVPDRINIIDWISLDANALYDIGKVLEGIKSNLGRGIAIVALQKSENAEMARGGQFVRDFSEVELLIDPLGENQDDVIMTIKGVKEKTAPIIGKKYAYTISGMGTEIINFREVKKCSACHASGYIRGAKCEICLGVKYVDV